MARQELRGVTISSIIRAMPYPEVLWSLMKPPHMYKYREDLLTYTRHPTTDELCLELTVAGLVLGQSSDPGVSVRHSQALRSLADAETEESRSKPLDMQRRRDIEVMESSCATDNAYKAAVEEFCATLSKHIRQGAGG